MTMAYHGIAHGWAGVAYATLMWARARDVEPPGGPAVSSTCSSRSPNRTDGGLAGRSHRGMAPTGPLLAGLVPRQRRLRLSVEPGRGTYREHVFAEMAERAAWLVGDSRRQQPMLRNRRPGLCRTQPLALHRRGPLALARRGDRRPRRGAASSPGTQRRRSACTRGTSVWPCSRSSSNVLIAPRCRCSSSSRDPGGTRPGAAATET